MIEISSRPPSAGLEALASEGASRLAAIDPRLAKLRLSIESGGPAARDSAIVAHLEFLLPEHQVILSRSHPHDLAAAVRGAFDAAAASLRAISRRDGFKSGAVAAPGRQSPATTDSDFDVTGSVEGDILVVTFTGRSTEQNADAMTRRYFEVVLGAGLRKVLADIRRLDARLSPARTYFLLRDLPVKPVPAGIRTAIVDSEKNREYVEFLETTAANAGVSLTSFVDYEGALDWLRAGSAVTRG